VHITSRAALPRRPVELVAVRRAILRRDRALRPERGPAFADRPLQPLPGADIEDRVVQPGERKRRGVLGGGRGAHGEREPITEPGAKARVDLGDCLDQRRRQRRGQDLVVDIGKVVDLDVGHPAGKPERGGEGLIGRDRQGGSRGNRRAQGSEATETGGFPSDVRAAELGLIQPREIPVRSQDCTTHHCVPQRSSQLSRVRS